MKFKSGILICMLLGLFMTFASCATDSEIGQANTSEPASIITTDLMVTALKASSFIDELTHQEQNVYIETTDLEFISSDFFKEKLTKSNLTFQFKNSLNKDFRIDFEFLNEKDELKFSLQIPVSAGSKEKPITVETSVIIEAPELEIFSESTKLVYKITLLSNDKPLMPESEGLLELHSDATYFFDF